MLQTASALADGASNPTVPIYGVCTLGFNGTTWDRLQVDASKFLKVNVAAGTVAATQSGTWNVTNISGTVSLPTGAATSAKQPALGTAGAASVDVLTVQGIASMTALKVDGSAVTQPVSGTFWQATQPVSGTVTANAGTGTFTVSQANLATADYDTGAGTTTQAMVGIALPASGGPVAGGTATNPLRTDPTGTTTQPVSGTVTANAGTGTFTVSGTVTVGNSTLAVTQSGTWNVATNADTAIAGTTAPSKLLLVGGKTADVTPAYDPLPLAAGGGSVVVSGTVAATQSGTWNVGTVTAVTTVSTVTSLTQFNGNAIDTNSGLKSAGTLRVVLATDQPQLTNKLLVTADPITFASAQAVTQSGTWTVATNADGTTGSAVPSKGLLVQGSDGTNARNLSTTTAGVLKVDLSATAANATAVKVDGSAVTQPVSNAGTFATQAAQSGTWTVQPGNTANTTPWLVTDTPATSGGLSFTHITAGASNNKTQVKGSAGQLYAIHAINLTATTKYIKVFDKTSANVTAGTTSADYQFAIPANSTTGAGFVMNLDKGVAHANGITVMLTGAVSLTDNTALSANDVVCTFFYH